MKKILVIAAHPDDEALGVSGTLARHSADGDTVHIHFMADGEGARGSTDNLHERRNMAKTAGEIMGAHDVQCHDFPDNQMDTISLLSVTQSIENIIDGIKPDIIYTHHGGDLNVDHKIVHRAVLTACRPMPENHVEAIYGFEVLSSTEWAAHDQDAVFRPNHHVDISKHMDKKMAAVKCYDAEMREFPHARSYDAVEALATLRGAQVGFKRAEAFTLIRSLR